MAAVLQNTGGFHWSLHYFHRPELIDRRYQVLIERTVASHTIKLWQSVDATLANASQVQDQKRKKKHNSVLQEY